MNQKIKMFYVNMFFNDVVAVTDIRIVVKRFLNRFLSFEFFLAIIKEVNRTWTVFSPPLNF